MSEIFSFGGFKEKLAPYDRPQVEEVCDRLCSMLRLRMLHLDRLCMHRPQPCKVSMTRSSVRLPFVKARGEATRDMSCCVFLAVGDSLTNTH